MKVVKKNSETAIILNNGYADFSEISLQKAKKLWNKLNIQIDEF